jgi:tetratricopeptide (TPR) repeat protein
MFIKYFKLVSIIVFFFQGPLYSKSQTLKNFNSGHLSNYFSGIVAYENKSNLEALKFFKSSKFLLSKHDPYLKRYIYALVLEGKIHQATLEIKQNLTKKNSNFFEAYLILALDSLKRKNFDKANDYLNKSFVFINNDKVSLVIYKTLKQYLHIFEKKQTPELTENFGQFSFINEVFQRCYVDDKDVPKYFRALINNNNNDGDYSRYIFFYINYLIENDKVQEVQKIASNLDYLNSSLLISQSKKWIEEKKLKNFNKIFSCKNSNDITSEFFFLVANLYSSENDYNRSNFYLNISHYLNPKFKFNLYLSVKNYYLNNNYKKTKEILEYFSIQDDIYYWFKLKKQAQIISKELSNEESLNFINEKFKEIKNPSAKIVFDIANFNKNSGKYQKAIFYYDQVLSGVSPNSEIYANILYRRGSSYERLGNYFKADRDFLKSLEIEPDDAYVLNYLAYSWLEREYKIDIAIEMLEKAYSIKQNDPYIIDSIGWAYYLIGDFLKAEIFLKKAVELMPDDPTVNDHYGDILWNLDRKIQARYFWKSVLNLKETEDKMKKNINIKLIEGPKNS